MKGPKPRCVINILNIVFYIRLVYEYYLGEYRVYRETFKRERHPAH